MIKIGASAKIEEISKKEKDQSKKKEKTKSVSTMYNTIRPEVVDAKVYKLKSAFVKNSVFITLSYVNDNTETRPIEIFIKSKDLTLNSDNCITGVADDVDASDVATSLFSAEGVSSLTTYF